MANPHKGEVSFEVRGKKRTARLNTNAICELEDELGMSVDGISSRMVSGYLGTLRSVLRASLHDSTTMEEAGEIIDELGPRRVVEVMIEAFNLAFPSPEEAPSPPKGGKAGTGAGS